ncbi:MAG TPA: acetoin utilization AcuC family protein, partial [Candidatus Limnocylindrales bacterium]|nr:acetoin utilization AcuC family protein [Candidatus Limnocylindrales bacterium]
MSTSNGPLLVFGPRSPSYDFGPAHPLTPRRFGPGIELLAAVGAVPGLAPEPASDAELARLHLPEYIATVRRLGSEPSGPGAMGIGLSDNPAFAGMHEAAATVAGGSLAAMSAILRGDVDHAHHPGGGLHHAMASKAWGFCIYNDVALAVARARTDGRRVLYVDLDVHHGDGVQALTLRDPGVLTVSFHESGRYLFPGTGSPDELGEGAAAGTAVNMPFEPYSGDAAWLTAVRALVPTLAAVFGPAVVVSQHGADAHAWDPLAHLRVTTTAMADAARLVDGVAHRWAGGRWLATGGGGYDAYRVVPRAWALTWLAGAHREPPGETPVAWRQRWEAEAGLHGFEGMPASFLDVPNAGLPPGGEPQRVGEERSLATLARVRAAVLPRLVREAEDRGWWGPSVTWAGHEVLDGVGGGTAGSVVADRAEAMGSHGPDPALAPTVVALTAERLGAFSLAPRVVAPFDPADACDLLASALRDGARVVAAVSASVIVGVAVAAGSATAPATESLLAVGVAPGFRGQGLGRALLRALVDGRPPGTAMEARFGVAE